MRSFLLAAGFLFLLGACTGGRTPAPDPVPGSDSDLFPSFDGQVIGNAGDPLEALFEQGRLNARLVVERTVRSEYAEPLAALLPDRALAPRLVAAREALMTDLRESRHLWVEELPRGCPSRETCACTRPFRRGHPLIRDVFLSRRQCERVKSPYAAGELLLHETLHHWRDAGASEELARGIAAAAYRLARRGGSDEPRWLPMKGTTAPETLPWPPYTRPGVHWTGSRLVIWMPGSMTLGFFYDPARDVWEDRPLSRDWRPWDESEGFGLWKDYLVTAWAGGRAVAFVPGIKRGAGVVIDPETEARHPVTVEKSPDPRLFPSRVLTTQSKVIAWGPRAENFGGLYDPVSDRWETIPSHSDFADREGQLVVTAEDSLVAWGGHKERTPLATGAIYSFEDRKWREIPPDPGAPGRSWPTGVWTGRFLILYGGWDERLVFQRSGRVYDAKLRTWKSTSPRYSPLALSFTPRDEAIQSVWTGLQMIVIEGKDVHLYDPYRDEWSSPERLVFPSLNFPLHLVWTGLELIAWDMAGGRGAIFLP